MLLNVSDWLCIYIVANEYAEVNFSDCILKADPDEIFATFELEGLGS